MLISNITSVDPLITNSTIQCTRFYTPPAKRRSASIDDMKRYLSRNPPISVQPEKDPNVAISFVHRFLGTFVCLEHDLAKNVFLSKIAVYPKHVLYIKLIQFFRYRDVYLIE
jgi:hypothetical protein